MDDYTDANYQTGNAATIVLLLCIFICIAVLYWHSFKKDKEKPRSAEKTNGEYLPVDNVGTLSSDQVPGKYSSLSEKRTLRDMLKFSEPISERDLPIYNPEEKLQITQREESHQKKLDEVLTSFFGDVKKPHPSKGPGKKENNAKHRKKSKNLSWRQQNKKEKSSAATSDSSTSQKRRSRIGKAKILNTLAHLRPRRTGNVKQEPSNFKK